jgi:hypothetical protein
MSGDHSGQGDRAKEPNKSQRYYHMKRPLGRIHARC